MKRTDFSVLAATLAYSFLFYKQSAGLNFLLFTVLICALLIRLHPQALRRGAALFALCASLFSGTFILVYASDLAVFANCVSLILFSAYCIRPGSSVIVNLLAGAYSASGSFAFIIMGFFKKKSDTPAPKKILYSLTYIIPLIFGLIFFFIYKNANPLFQKYTEKLNLDFISVGWLFFTLGGFLIVLGLLNHQRIKAIDELEDKIPAHVTESTASSHQWDEKKALILLFAFLNLLLIFINILDVNYLYLGAGMPVGVTHKQFVHHGVGMLILSIVLGISLVLYFFRGELNFGDRNKMARRLAYLWIAQNLFMVISTAMRNDMYISDALLTYKRIGVYCWLFMAACGLISAAIKIRQARSGWYLFKVNAMIAFAALTLCTAIDWDKLIGDFNVKRSKLTASLDKRYLMAISDVNLPLLYSIRDKKGFEVDSFYHYQFQMSKTNSQVLSANLYFFLKTMDHEGWRSFSFRKQRILEELKQLNAQGKIRSIDLTWSYVASLKPIRSMNNIRELIADNMMLDSLNALSYFTHLEKLNLNTNKIASLELLPALPELKELYLDNNNVTDLKPLERLRSLQVLHLTGNEAADVNTLPPNLLLKELSLQNDPSPDLSRLAVTPNIEKLFLGNQLEGIEKFPVLDKLEMLEIRQPSDRAASSFKALPKLPSLHYLDLSSGGIVALSVLLQSTEDGRLANTKFPALQRLDLDNNNYLSYLTYVDQFPGLQSLNVMHCSLKSLENIQSLKKLRGLFAGHNALESLAPLAGLRGLRKLSLNDNALLSDLDALKDLDSLDYLDLANTRFNDLSLIHAQGLLELDLSGCRLTTLQGIGKLGNLETLRLSYIKKEDIPLLQQLKKLRHLTVSKTDDETVKKLRKQLAGVEISDL